MSKRFATITLSYEDADRLHNGLLDREPGKPFICRVCRHPHGEGEVVHTSDCPAMTLAQQITALSYHEYK